MRHQQDARVINVNKTELLKKIEENKENHIKEYNQAVIDYRAEAKKQLDEQLKKLEEGDLKISIQLTSPVNNSEEYDKIRQMFLWEIKDVVELSQGEFNEYILDETQFAKIAKLSNLTYSRR